MKKRIDCDCCSCSGSRWGAGGYMMYTKKAEEKPTTKKSRRQLTAFRLL